MPGAVDVREDVLFGLELEPAAHDRGGWSVLDGRLDAATVRLGGLRGSRHRSGGSDGSGAGSGSGRALACTWCDSPPVPTRPPSSTTQKSSGGDRDLAARPPPR